MRYLAPALVETMVAERKMAFVAGPRQVGKTTLARTLLPEDASGYCNWDVETHRRRVLREPVDFWQAGGDASGRTRIVLDEIHKYPRWKRLLKGLFDEHRDRLEVLVTGSGRLDTYQRGGDSLLGRYNLYRLHPFTAGELVTGGAQQVPSPVELTERLRGAEAAPAGAAEAVALIERYSGFPEPVFGASAARLTRWRRMRRQLVLREDLRDLSRVRELGLVEQLVALLPERVGSPLSINALREDLQVAFTTVQNWLTVLERLYFLFELRPYAGRLARTLRREGKVYLFDPTEIEHPGCRFENIVALHLLKLVDAWNDHGYGDYGLHYVRDKEKREVDFLITERRRPFLLVEAKLEDVQPSPSLRYFAERLPVKHAVQIVRSGTVRTSGGIQVLPADRVLAWM